MKRTISKRKLAIAKAATTMASSKYHVGQMKRLGPKPVTLPKLKCLEKSDQVVTERDEA